VLQVSLPEATVGEDESTEDLTAAAFCGGDVRHWPRGIEEIEQPVLTAPAIMPALTLFDF